MDRVDKTKTKRKIIGKNENRKSLENKENIDPKGYSKDNNFLVGENFEGKSILFSNFR